MELDLPERPVTLTNLPTEAVTSVRGRRRIDVTQLSSASASDGVLVIRTLDDLPPPDGGAYTLTEPAILLPDEQPLGQPRTLTLPDGMCLVIKEHASLSGVGYRTARISGSYTGGVVRLEGGSVEYLEVANFGGGFGSSDIEHVSGVNSVISECVVLGEECGVMMSGNGGALRCSGVLASNENGASRGFVVGGGTVNVGMSLLSCFANNATGAADWVAVDVEANATLLLGFVAAQCSLIGGFFGVPGTGENNVGIRVHPTSSSARFTYTTNQIIGFGGVGAAELEGVTKETPTAIIHGNFPVTIDTRPFGNVTLDTTSEALPPVTSAVLADTWYPIAATGSVLEPDATLYGSPTDGVLQNLYAFATPSRIEGKVSLEKLGGGVVVTKVRVAQSTDGGANWTPISAPAAIEAEARYVQFSATGFTDVVPGAMFRMELASVVAGTSYNTRAVELSAGS